MTDLVRLPAYALGGRVVCFFQESAKFKTLHCTLGFSDTAALDDFPSSQRGLVVARARAAD